MRHSVIEADDYIHPNELSVNERASFLPQLEAWADSAIGDDLDGVSRYICSASYYRVPSGHPVAMAAESAAARFGLDSVPAIYIARRFSYEPQISGYREPAVIIPSQLIAEKDENILRCRLCAAMAGVNAGHHRLEYLLWIAENMAGTIPLQFADKAALGLLYEWKRAMRYSQDRGVYLATGNRKEALRNILYGTVPNEILRKFDFGINGTFEKQVMDYGMDSLMSAAGHLSGMLQDYAYLPDRYNELLRFMKGRGE